jgi:F-type H+-transporting ATPase subunit c
MELQAAKLLAAAIALTPIIGVGIGLGIIFGAYNMAVARNPNAADILEKKFWLTFAFVEMFGLVAIVAWALLYFTGG